MSKQHRRSLDRLVESVLFESALYEEFGSRVFAPGTEKGFDPVVGNTLMQQTVKAAPDDTVGEEVPLVPSAEMTVQLTAEAPPVDDEEYVPASAVQFGLAMQVLADDMSAEELKKLYWAVKRGLVTQVSEGVMSEATPRKRSPSSRFEDITDKELYADIDEEEKEDLEKMIAQLKDVKGHTPWSDIGTSKDPIHKIRGGEDEAELEDIVEPVEVTPDGLSLEDLAQALGLKAASGAKQAIGRIVRRTDVIDRLMTPKQLSGLQTFATIQFIKYMAPFVDEEDVEELKLNRNITRDLDSYRFFFVNSFILPVYNKVYRRTRKDIEGRLVRSGFPKRSAATVANVLFGETVTTPEKLKAKIEKDLLQAESVIGVDELLDRLKGVYPTLRNLAKLQAYDVDALARERWNGFNDARKEKEVLTALDESGKFQGELDEKKA